MARDAKPSANQETSKIAFPMPRRASLASSFSLPSLSLSRSKTTPTLAPLDTNRANGHPLDGEDTRLSHITPSVGMAGPPSSPGTAVPLPSIRSLRSRFSFTSQEPPNLPSVLVQTPNKRVTSRRFLPFGNSASNQAADNTPSVPRKSLGDVFALGRASTSSRYDSSSARSATPSSRSTRSVTSAATMRGAWSHNSSQSGLAPPKSPSSRPRSDDFTALSADLGYVLAIGSGEDTIRRRPDAPPAEVLPRQRDSDQTIVEVSWEDPALTNSPSVSTPPVLDVGVARSLDTADDVVILPTTINHLASGRPRQSPVPPISIPPPSKGGIAMVQLDYPDTEQRLGTVIEYEPSVLDSSTTAYPFTPVDDRSDVTSSTNNTPSSTDRLSRKNSHNIPPRIPSPSPASASASRDSPHKRDLPVSVDLAKALSSSWLNQNGLEAGLSGSATTGSAHLGQKPSYPHDRLGGRSAQGLQIDTRDAVANPGFSFLKVDLDARASLASALGLVEESYPTPKSEFPVRSSMDIEADARESRRNKLERLVPSLITPISDGESFAQKSDLSGSTAVNQDTPHFLTSKGLGDVAHPSTKGSTQDARYLDTVDDDLTRLLSPNRFSPTHVVSASEPGNHQDRLRTPASAHPSLPSGPLTPQIQPSPLQRPGSRLPQKTSTPSSSVTPGRTNDLSSTRTNANLQRGDPGDRNAISLNNSPMLSPKKLANAWSWGEDQREPVTTPDQPGRPLPRRSPSVSAAMARKRSASFDLSGSDIFAKDTGDPFVAQPNGLKRTDWLGPKTARAFAAAGLLEKDRERSGPYLAQSETPGYRGAALNAWRTHSDRNGIFGSGPGSVRSHSRLGSEIISPSYRTRSVAGGDLSPSFRRSSLDYTAPPSPVSTHRTLVSNGTSSSQSQQSALQNLRERHELETEALLLALAGSKRVERDLRAENDELVGHILQLEKRIAQLEAEREQFGRSQSRARERRWDTPPPSDVDTFDKRRQEIMLGRPASRALNIRNKLSIAGNGALARGINRPFLSPNETPRSVSVASVRRPATNIRSRSSSPSKYLDLADTSISSHRSSSSTRGGATFSQPPVSTPETEFDEWSEASFNQPLQSSPKQDARHRLSSHSVVSLIPQIPGSMSLLVHEQPGGEFGAEDDVSFGGSASPSSMTLVHPRSNTPKPMPANISPITADFSFNSIPGSPRSLRLRPEEEMHLADLISLQGLEITDVLATLDS
ncbi:hypothetical protein CTheo_2845 [Ceratobasidium theobromae]|uniref:Uncharacterized protein n=1 Tax=Ceratobasidium theobromae TaxID=1582974 RepID=A0A5N5QPR1_9AGAM|nr:hypothetical protein CTheo_2845 [Ceratobasidium theobromae]